MITKFMVWIDKKIEPLVSNVTIVDVSHVLLHAVLSCVAAIITSLFVSGLLVAIIAGVSSILIALARELHDHYIRNKGDFNWLDMKYRSAGAVIIFITLAIVL